MRAPRLHGHHVKRLARRHEELVPPCAAEADVGADLRQADLANALAVGREDVDAVVAVAHPAGADPDVALLVAADAVAEAAFPAEVHVAEGARVAEAGAVHVVAPDDILRLLIVRLPAVGDIEAAVVGGEADAVRLERLVRY